MSGEKHYSINVLAKRLMSSRVCPRGDGTLHPATMTKWIRYGCRSVTGQVVKLEAVRLGSRWFVSMEAVARFTAALAGGTQTNTDTTPAAPAHLGAAAAAERLKALGA